MHKQLLSKQKKLGCASQRPDAHEKRRRKSPGRPGDLAQRGVALAKPAEYISLADDIIRGAARIGAFVGLEPRPAFYALEKGHIPGRKEGGVWVSTKSLLWEFYNSAAPAKPAELVASEGSSDADPPHHTAQGHHQFQTAGGDDA